MIIFPLLYMYQLLVINLSLTMPPVLYRPPPVIKSLYEPANSADCVCTIRVFIYSETYLQCTPSMQN